MQVSACDYPIIVEVAVVMQINFISNFFFFKNLGHFFFKEFTQF